MADAGRNALLFRRNESAPAVRSNSSCGVRACLSTRLGGTNAVKGVVAEMYDRLLADEVTAPFFEGVNMAHLKQHQVEFMKIAFTEIPKDLDVNALLKERHMRLFLGKGLNATHFDKVANHFIGACIHLGVAQDLISEAVSVIRSLRPIFEKAAIENLDSRRNRKSSAE